MDEESQSPLAIHFLLFPLLLPECESSAEVRARFWENFGPRKAGRQ
jgi:hypothetical protein